ncbi:MAG: hypothetical protein HYW48_00060 [Deltaproteobacteria bacterium]|nr:hypothetical protein [Deltaproteobacteria bacterium]
MGLTFENRVCDLHEAYSSHHRPRWSSSDRTFGEIPADLPREEAEQRVRQLVSDLRLHGTCSNQSNKQASVWSRECYDWKEGPRILVLEEEIPGIFALGRYKKRIFDVLESDDTGKYSPATELMVEGMSAEFLQLIEITGRKSSYFSASDLEKLNPNLSELFKDDMNRLSGSHSMAVMSILGEYAPFASFILARPFSPPKEALCKKEVEKIRDLAADAGRSLVQYLQANPVDIINMSGGVDLRTMKKYYQTHCHAELDSRDGVALVEAFRPFFTELDKAQVLVVQAAASGLSASESPLDASPDWLVHRLRVNFVDKNKLGLPIAEMGESAASMTGSYVTEKAANADVLLALPNHPTTRNVPNIRPSPGEEFATDALRDALIVGLAVGMKGRFPWQSIESAIEVLEGEPTAPSATM